MGATRWIEGTARITSLAAPTMSRPRRFPRHRRPMASCRAGGSRHGLACDRARSGRCSRAIRAGTRSVTSRRLPVHVKGARSGRARAWRSMPRAHEAGRVRTPHRVQALPRDMADRVAARPLAADLHAVVIAIASWYGGWGQQCSAAASLVGACTDGRGRLAGPTSARRGWVFDPLAFSRRRSNRCRRPPHALAAHARVGTKLPYAQGRLNVGPLAGQQFGCAARMEADRRKRAADHRHGKVHCMHALLHTAHHRIIIIRS
jgi:hypothetical protein